MTEACKPRSQDPYELFTLGSGIEIAFVSLWVLKKSPEMSER